MDEIIQELKDRLSIEVNRTYIGMSGNKPAIQVRLMLDGEVISEDDAEINDDF